MFVAQRVLGIDPGLTRCGYAVLDSTSPGTRQGGVARRDAHAADRCRCRSAWPRCRPSSRAARRVPPRRVAVEQVFFQVNVRTAMSVGQASGLALAEAAAAGCEVVQYTPNQVKDAVAGWGGADKAQVQKMVQVRLGLAAPPAPADAADAAALALCHLAVGAVAPAHRGDGGDGGRR